MFKGYYRQRFRDIFGKSLSPLDGLGDAKVRRELEKRRIAIPLALTDYYAVAGNHSVNSIHNRLFPIQNLEWESDRLVIMEEDQCVAVWGIDRAGIEEVNPVVWQATYTQQKQLDWYEEPYLLNQFLMAMWHLQETGIEEKAERRRKRRNA